MLPIRYSERGRQEVWPRPFVTPTPLPSGFRSLGFDVVNDSTEIGYHVECSPLSCKAERGPVNAHCLLDDLGTTHRSGRRFADGAEPVEPGPYFVVEVLRDESL